MANNDVTGDKLVTAPSTDAYRDGWDAIWEKTPPYRCLYCGERSWIEPFDQSPPPDYCHESDHGSKD